MRPVVGTAVLLLVVLMFISDTEAGIVSQWCKTNSPAIQCKKNINNQDWFQMGENRCGKVFTQPLSFDDAEGACGKYGGHLVSLQNDVEMGELVCTTYRLSDSIRPYWIGLKATLDPKSTVPLDYEWSDGTSTDYAHYLQIQHEGRPTEKTVECVDINQEYWSGLSSQRCSERKPYACAVNV